MTIAVSKLRLFLAFASLASGNADNGAHHMREETPRLMARGSFNNLQATLRVFQPLQESPTVVETQTDENDADTELMELFTSDFVMSMPTTTPSDFPSDVPSDMPSALPSATPTDQPSSAPSLAPTTLTPAPTLSAQPSVAPSVSQAPSPSEPVPTTSPSSAPSTSPSSAPSFNPTKQPTVAPTLNPSAAPSVAPSVNPSSPPSGSIKDIATVIPITPTPTREPSSRPSVVPSSFPTSTPTVEGCTVSAVVREIQILALLDSVADPVLIRDVNTPQGLATEWLLSQDSRKICPDDPKILQRWVLAVMYFSTGGEQWLQCSNNILATDDCGNEEPFEAEQRFLSAFHECEWAGIDCNELECVTEIEFELNNLVGTIPSEIGLLTDLERWGMERGGLMSTIPTEIEALSRLTFLDLDFNELTGSLTTQLLSLSNLEQLDLNNNQLTGAIDGIRVFPNMVFLQLHDNEFTGTVPATVGSFAQLTAFTLHETDISGVMPQSVCSLLTSNLDSLIADCQGNNPNIDCACCTDCRQP